MKRISTLLVAAAFSLVCSMQAWSANITMPMSYANEPNATVTVTEESTLTYSGYWAESETSNPVSVHLVPAAGQTLRVTCTQMYGFDTCDAELKVYNGAASISYSLPAGDMGAVAEGKVFESTAADGSLTVAYSNEEDEYVKYSFKVELVAGGDMEYTATEAVSLPNPIIGASLQPVAAANVKTAGAGNALSATQVAFVLSDASAVSGARVYYSKKAPFNISEAGLFGASKVDGTTVTATGSLPLAAGDNYFWLVGDVSTTAAVGSAITAQCTSVKIGGEEKITSPVASTVTVGNELNMPSAGTFAIGASGLNFYDDGGKDGKISSKFEGVVTFKPTTPGKVVQIDFSKVELYESTYGSDSYNDKIKVYNGTTVSDANLNAQVMNGKPVVLRSSAADGSLTVWMKSVTGDYYRGKGFEAFVSEYSPAPMTVKTVTTAQVADNTSTAGSTDQPILSVCVKTENTEAVNATKLTFETEGTTDINHLQKATVYYTAKSSTFATATKLGEAVPTGKQEFSIAFDQQLVEGENWFWLAYDIDPKAQTGEILDAGCKSIEIGGASYSPATVNPDGNSSVKNELLSTVGTVEKTIYGTWTFKNTPNPYVGNNGYEPVIGDQITTFIPGDNDMIVELDIKSFALYYSANANYPRAKFEVYSGKGTTGELLWSLTGEADKNVGPGKILRSKSVDGALTVVFDAKTETSGYTAKGWDAEVREYRQRPMEVSSVKATQASTDIVNKGAVNQELLGVDIQTAGNISPVVLKGIKFNMKGCQANVAKLHVYTSGQKNELTKETSIADIDVTAETAEANITFARPLELAEGSNYFWLTADIADEAATDTNIDAAVTAVTTATATINVAAEQGDPEGARTVKNTYNLQAGDNGEIVVGNEALIYYDHGGADGKSPKNFEGQVTFRPKDAGKVVKLTFKSFSTSYNDNFYIYYGGKKTSTPDVKVSKMLEAPIVSVADDGKLTVYFKCPSYSYASNGWAIEVSQYELLPLSVGNMAITSVAAGESLRGSKNVPMLRAEATIDGDKGEMDFSKFVVSADGSAEGTIAAAKIFVTTTDQFSANNLIGSANTAPFEIATDYKATAPGKYYFWVAYDFNANAAEGNLGTAALTAYTANGAETSTMASITAQTAMKAGKKGVYTVGEGGDYATIQAAVDDIATGIEGAVTVNILSGEYNEKVNIPEIPGSSDVNTVTIQSATGNYSDVKIFHNAYTDPGYNTDKYGVVTFNGADYVTLRGVTVTSTDKTFPALVYMINTSQHDTVDACHLYADRIESSTTAEQLVLVRQLAIDKENCNNDYFTLSNCLLEGGYRGAIIGGTSYVALTHQTGCVVEGNTFRDNAASALSAYSGDNNITIRGNVIENNTTTLSRGFNGLDLQFGDNCIVEGNTMHIDLGVEAIGIYVRKGASTADKRSRIVNNEVSVKSSDYTSAAIKVNGKTPNVDIAYNTAVVAGHENNVACYLNDAMEAMTVRNNIFLARDNGLVYRTYKDADAAAITFSNNVLHTNGTVFAQTSSNTKLASFSDWMLKVNEQSSFNEDVAFLSDKMLFPAAAGNLLNAMPLDFVTTDLLGVVRNATTPTIGAYEYADASAVPAFDEGYPAISGISHNAATAVLKTAANGKAYLMVKESSETAPTADEMKASTLTATLRAGKEVSVSLNGLSSQTEYRLYTLLESLDGTNVGEVAATDAFTTTYLPTEVSTFENVKVNDSGFDDGTASFAGFTVVDADDAVVEGTKVAKIEGAGAVQLTNTDKGLTLTGFFVKTDAEVAMNVYDGNADAHAYTIPATSGKWIFFNLKDKGAVTALDFATEGNAYIDNFSGEPLPLTAACT
ncbi:MAG: right-handed parallel beta-helix repeat-containing protein, partial [Muribaculaceae bacterium]|nr:right-handed parallel beta-helix repeat-containing protein [Muribaculaceae bacterium]